MSPEDDIKEGGKVSEFEKTQDFVVCKVCGALYPLGESTLNAT